MLILLAVLQLQAASTQQAQASPAQQVVEGNGAASVAVPRLQEEIEVDGHVDEPVWQRAVRLTGFHQYQPVDGRPAEEATEVLVWYSPQSIYFGIIAHARNPSTIRATLADRDNIDRDDRVTIYLDTFNDRRRAFFFGVNPLGVQLDGVRTEGPSNAGSLTSGSVDQTPDYYFESKGRVTDQGYEVEVRIPFKSLRFPARGPQRWGLNIVRDIPATGYQDTWTDVRRASASFLAQSGTIEGLVDLERGVLTEVQPFVTATANGERDLGTGRFVRDNVEPSAGANVRVGLPQISLDATLNPDFSQVESDAGLVTVNERFALFIPEKRPFFLEGIELFATPNQLVYTRRIVDPVGGGKVTGKFGPYGIAHLTAVDQTSGHDALFNVTRLRRDFGGNSVAGVTLTDRESDGTYNRLLAADSRVVFGELYYVLGQLGASSTRDSLGPRSAPIWRAEYDRTGRFWGFNYLLNGIGEDFESDAGFVPRTGIVEGQAFNRFRWYGRRGARLESFTTYFGPTRLWNYESFWRDRAIEGRDEITGIAQLRGGWIITGTVARQFFVLDPAAFSGYEVDRGVAGVEPYNPPRKLGGLLDALLEVQTPVYQGMDATVSIERIQVPIFNEGAEGRATIADATLHLRPTPSLRIEGTGVLSRITRARDGSHFARTLIPRLKVEYQLTRALFFRVVGEYRSEERSALLDARTGNPLLIDGVRADATEFGGLRMDWLASFEPTPGTVAFLGYGSSHESTSATSLGGLRHTADGVFVKLAYQFRR